MNRKLCLGHFHLPGSAHHKSTRHLCIRRAIGIAIVVAGWTFFLTDWLESAPTNTSESPQLIQKMIWNPSPK